MLDTTVNGFCGSRISSRCAGTRLDSGVSGADGLSKSGLLLGAQAATCMYGGAVSRGGASGF